MLPGLSKEQLVEILRRMLLIRRFEEKVAQLAQQRKFPGHFHLYIGQEATGVAALLHLGPDDYIFTTHRNHGHVLARGGDPGRSLAEILGREGGYNRGKGGTLHLAVKELGIPLTSAIVGDIVPIATGAAYALKQLGGDGVSMAFFGDGALEEGAFYESINLAALWRLPVIYICENNSVGLVSARAGEYPISTIIYYRCQESDGSGRGLQLTGCRH